MIDVVNLVKMYGSFRAVDGLCLHIDKGEIFGFVGPNGAGKTTTMKIIAGLLPATAGSVIVKDVDVIKHPRILREKIGYMPDFFGVYDNLKVSEYMDFYAGAYYIPYAERPPVINDLLELVGLTFKADAYVDSLSRGMKQRLCLARALIHDPEVLLLDEPASGLDPRARVEMKEVLKQLKAMGKTIIISSHILTELAELCSVVGIMDHGRLAAYGSVNDIMRQLNHGRTLVIKPLAMSEAFIRALREQPGVSGIQENTTECEVRFTGDDAETARLLGTLVTNNIPIVSYREREGNLEEMFMQLTEGGKEE